MQSTSAVTLGLATTNNSVPLAQFYALYSREANEATLALALAQVPMPPIHQYAKTFIYCSLPQSHPNLIQGRPNSLFTMKSTYVPDAAPLQGQQGSSDLHPSIQVFSNSHLGI